MTQCKQHEDLCLFYVAITTSLKGDTREREREEKTRCRTWHTLPSTSVQCLVSCLWTSVFLFTLQKHYLPIATYDSETWSFRVTRCISRKSLKIICVDHVTKKKVLRWADTQPLQNIVRERRLRFIGHALSIPENRHAKSNLAKHIEGFLYDQFGLNCRRERSCR